MFLSKKKIFILIFIFISITASTVFYFADIKLFKTAKSSAIPLKREFPVNKKINPCVNFYEYACSKVNDSFKLREDRSRHTFSFSDASERLLEFKKKYFSDLAKKKPESAMEKEVKVYYSACMNKEAQKKEERTLVDDAKKRLAKIKTKEHFLEMIAKDITSASRLSFISFGDLPNLDRPAYNDLIFYTALKSLPERSYYENKPLVKDLKSLMEKFFVVIGEKQPKKKANWVFNFEKELMQIYPTPPEIEEMVFTRTKITRKELIDNYPYLKLSGFLKDIPRHVVIRNIIGNKTMSFLNKKLKTLSLEELKAIYLYFQLKSIIDEAYPDFFQQKFVFNKKYLGGPNKRPDVQERCTKKVMRDFAKEVDFILLPKLFPNFPKQKFIKSIEKIRRSLIKQLARNDWLSSSAKKEAIRKIKKTKLALVSPNNKEEWYFNPRADYSLNAPIINDYKLGQLLLDRSLKELQGPINTDRWHMSPLTVNAGCAQFYNKIVFPVGILQYPFYDPKEPEEVNLAAIGMVIGHELGHLIDNHGDKFDADGRFRSWMLAKDKKSFDERAKYLIEQFNKIGHNGKFTLGENIGDLVGLTTAYQAAFPDDKKINRDLQKKFFLQQARLWCGVEREGVTKVRLKTDPHSLGWARVNEQVKHRKGFREAYNCKPVDPLVIPEEEMVKIW